jgi:hypothetical protein
LMKLYTLYVFPSLEKVISIAYPRLSLNMLFFQNLRKLKGFY